ncbi:MAG: hypothetical protein WC376_03595, partial [Candidatus Nanoarchaeia archaeon]
MKLNNGFKSVLLSGFLITVLLLGSDSAFAVAMHINDVVVNGRELSFSVDIDINENERLPIELVAVLITNSTGTFEDNTSWEGICIFTVDGTMLDNETIDITDLCSNFNVTPVTTQMNYSNSSGYGYGYYYGYGYVNASYDYGYGYVSGYDYGTALGPEFKYNVTWMAPNENADYKIMVATLTNDDSKMLSTVDAETFSVSKTTEDEEETVYRYAPRAHSNPASNVTVIIDQILGDLKDFIGSDVTNYTLVSNVNLTQTLSVMGENITQTFASFGEEVVSAITNALGTDELVDVSITTNVKVVQVTMSDGTVANYTMIERTFNNLGNITVIEVIPKSIASSAAMISGDFTILLDDPVLEFNIVPNGKLSYLINGEVDTGSIETLASQAIPEDVSIAITS